MIRYRSNMMSRTSLRLVSASTVVVSIRWSSPSAVLRLWSVGFLVLDVALLLALAQVVERLGAERAFVAGALVELVAHDRFHHLLRLVESPGLLQREHDDADQ